MKNFAVIGRNFVVDSFLESCAECADVHLLAVYSRREDTARTYAEKHGAERIYTDLSALAADPDIDFVYIASPNACHEAQAVALLEGGKHVLVEKPAAPDREGFARMCAAADKNHRVLMEAMMPAHLPALDVIRKFLQEIAPVRFADFSYCQYSSRYDKFKNGIIENAFDPTLGNGALMDIGIYCVHMLTNLFGMPQEVDGSCLFLDGSIDGCGTVTVKYPHLLARLTYSKITDGKLPCEIQGEKGCIHIDCMSRPHKVTLLRRDGSQEVYETENTHTDMYYELCDFLSCINGASAAPFRRVTDLSLAVTDLARAKMGVDFQKHKTEESTMKKKAGYAVVGLGVGVNHVKAAANSERADLIAVCDLIQEKLDKISAEYPGTLTYLDFDEMLKNPDIDIVSICVPSGMHADLAVRALEAGKNVLVEKPIDITVEAAMRIEEARVRTGKKAGVIHQNRNNADMAPILDAVRSGRLGDLFYGDFEVKWFRTQEYYDNGGWRGTWEMDGGGSLMNQAVHTVDLMQWIMGDVKSVTSKAGIYNHKIETEDFTASLIEFKSGAVATFVSTTCAYPGLNTGIKVYGTKGSIEADGDTLLLWKIQGAEEGEEAKMLETYAGNSSAAALDPTLCTGHASMVEDMIAAVLDDRDPQILPLEAIKSVRIVNAVYESAKTGKPVIFD